MFRRKKEEAPKERHPRDRLRGFMIIIVTLSYFVLQQMLHKLHIGEVDEARVALIKRRNLLHIFIGETKVEDV